MHRASHARGRGIQTRRAHQPSTRVGRRTPCHRLRAWVRGVASPHDGAAVARRRARRVTEVAGVTGAAALGVRILLCSYTPPLAPVLTGHGVKVTGLWEE